MKFDNKRWVRDADTVMECEDSRHFNKGFWSCKRTVEFVLDDRSAVFHYQHGKYLKMFLPQGDPQKITGDFRVYFVHRGPFELHYTFQGIPVRGGETDCHMVIRAEIAETDLDVFRKAFGDRRRLSLKDLAWPFTIPVRNGLSGIARDYSYESLKTGRASEIKAVENAIAQTGGRDFAQKGVTFLQVISIDYHNASREMKAALQREAEELEANQRIMGMMSEKAFMEQKTEAEARDQAERLAHEMAKRKLIRGHEMDMIREEFLADKERREFLRSKYIEKENLLHRINMEEFQFQHQQNMREQEREAERIHLEKTLEIENRDIDEKYETLKQLRDVVNAVNTGRIKDLESMVAKLSMSLDVMPEQLNQVFEESFADFSRKASAQLDNLIAERLSGVRWEQTRTILKSASEDQAFKVEIWTEINGEPATYADARPGGPFRCSVRSNRSGYLTVFDHSTSGKLIRLFPNPVRKDNRIEAGRIMTTDRDFLPGYDAAETFKFAPDTPPGIERIEAVVTEQNVDMKKFFPHLQEVRMIGPEEDGFKTLTPEEYIEGMIQAREVVLGKKKDPELTDFSMARAFMEFNVLDDQE